MLKPWCFMCSKIIMTGRLIKWNLEYFMSMHRAKGTKQLPNWREMIMEQLEENLLLHDSKKYLTFTTKTWNSCCSQICTRVFILNARVLAVYVKHSMALTFVLYKTQTICLVVLVYTYLYLSLVWNSRVVAKSHRQKSMESLWHGCAVEMVRVKNAI